MTTTDLKNLKVARRYAEGFFGTSKHADRDLEFIRTILQENQDFYIFLTNPVIAPDDKKNVLKSVTGQHVAPATLDFLSLLIDNSRLNIFNTVCDCYKRLSDRENKISRVKVVSAVTLQNDEKQKLISVLSEKLKTEVLLECERDKNILGGLIVEFGDKVIDLSILGRLKSRRTAK